MESEKKDPIVGLNIRKERLEAAVLRDKRKINRLRADIQENERKLSQVQSEIVAQLLVQNHMTFDELALQLGRKAYEEERRSD